MYNSHPHFILYYPYEYSYEPISFVVNTLCSDKRDACTSCAYFLFLYKDNNPHSKHLMSMICSNTSLNVLVLLDRLNSFNGISRTFSMIYIWMQERVIVYLDRFRWCHLQHHKYKLI